MSSSQFTNGQLWLGYILIAGGYSYLIYQMNKDEPQKEDDKSVTVAILILLGSVLISAVSYNNDNNTSQFESKIDAITMFLAGVLSAYSSYYYGRTSKFILVLSFLLLLGLAININHKL